MSLLKIKLALRDQIWKRRSTLPEKRVVAEATMYEYGWCDTAKMYLGFTTTTLHFSSRFIT